MAKRKHDNGVEKVDSEENLVGSRHRGRMMKQGKGKDSHTKDKEQRKKGQKRKSEETSVAVEEKKKRPMAREGLSQRKKSERGSRVKETKKKNNRKTEDDDDYNDVKIEEPCLDDTISTKKVLSQIKKKRTNCKEILSVTEVKNNCDTEVVDTLDCTSMKNTNSKSHTNLHSEQESPKHTNGMLQICEEKDQLNYNKGYHTTSMVEVKKESDVGDEVGIMSESDDSDFEPSEKKSKSSDVKRETAPQKVSKSDRALSRKSKSGEDSNYKSLSGKGSSLKSKSGEDSTHKSLSGKGSSRKSKSGEDSTHKSLSGKGLSCKSKSSEILSHKSKSGESPSIKSKSSKGATPKSKSDQNNTNVSKERPENDETVSSAKKPKLSEKTNTKVPSKGKKMTSSLKKSEGHSKSPKTQKEMDKSRKSMHIEKKSKCTKGKTEMKSDVFSVNADQGDVMSLLLQMEGGGMYQPGHDVKPGVSRDGTNGFHGDDSDEVGSDEEESDWEEVEDDPRHKSPKKSQIPTEPVQVTIDAPDFIKKRKKKEFDLNAYVKRQMNRFQKELREDMHKVHLMLLLARGMYLNRICSDMTLQAVTLSIIPKEYIHSSPSRYNLSSVERLMTWYSSTISMDSSLEVHDDLKTTLVKRLGDRKVASTLEYVLIFVASLRCIGIQTRLALSLQPLPIKASVKKAGKASVQKKSVKDNQSPGQKGRKVEKGRKCESKLPSADETRTLLKDSKKLKERSTLPAQGKNCKNKSSARNSSKGKALRKRGSTVNYKVESGSDLEESEEEYTPEEEDCEEGNEDRRNKSKKAKSRSKKAKIAGCRKNESEDDFEENVKEYRTPINKSVLMKKSSTNKKILSSDSEIDTNEQGVDHWVEVYLENKWICVDCLHKQLNRPYRLESGATQPVHYVVSYFQDGSLKDVTARYASNWMTDTRKLRTDPGWWEDTVNPYRPLNVKSDQKEDSEIKVSLMKRPMPTSVAAFKNHPLYALRRHLLKYEAIYPDSAAPLGFVRGEPVYARECIHELHSRDNWLKEARAVRVGEKAYKMVKSRAKWNRPKENPDALDLELYGLWQTEDYMPPPAVDGKVPKNEYGNIELFKPCMLPIGTVHLQVPGLNKVAKKLNIDCVPAMVGWDSHCGFSVPLLDGFVVCEEHKETLMAAWEEEQEIQKQREAEKREKRALNNWKVLIKGLLIKDRLKKRFDLQEQEKTDPCEEETKKFSNSEKATDAELSWPRKQQEQRAKKTKGKNSISAVKEDNATSAHYQVETL